MSETLEMLMGSKARARVMRFFVLNPGKSMLFADIKEKTQIASPAVRKEIAGLQKLGLVKSTTKNKKKYYELNDDFVYYRELRNLFVKSNTYPQCSEVKNLRSVGTVKLVMISGVFMNYSQANIDLLIVGNNINRTKLLSVIAAIEAEIGHEVRFMALGVDDFKYRIEMMDRFLIELLAGPHDSVINKMPTLNRFITEIKG